MMSTVTLFILNSSESPYLLFMANLKPFYFQASLGFPTFYNILKSIKIFYLFFMVQLELGFKSTVFYI